MQNNHTPMQVMEYFGDDTYAINNKDGNMLFMVKGHDLAESIIKCVNAHDDLVAALRECKDVISDFISLGLVDDTHKFHVERAEMALKIAGAK